jgi:hypothetical protein
MRCIRTEPLSIDRISVPNQRSIGVSDAAENVSAVAPLSAALRTSSLTGRSRVSLPIFNSPSGIRFAP